MIISRIEYGLGNQLFQYAFGRLVSYYKNEELKLDISWYSDEQYNPKKNYTPRSFLLKKFNINALPVDQKELKRFLPLGGMLPANLHTYYKKYFKKSYFNSGNVELWNHSSKPEQLISALKLMNNDIYIKGLLYNQSLYEPIRASLIEELQLSDHHEIKESLYAKLHDSDTVFVHIRRGDYIEKRQHDLGGICDLVYYKNAISYMQTQLAKPFFFFFSDDPEWAKSNFTLPNGYHSKNKGDQPHLDLDLMRKCKHGIISNSTFSWWAAWLIESREKVIISPKIWSKTQPELSEKLIDKNWIKL